MSTILTVTLNPAYDIHYTVPDFAMGQERYIEKTIVAAGGKGVNVARAIQKNGGQCMALITAGSSNSELFRRKLQEEGISFRMIDVPGAVRENITIHAPGQNDTRISQDNFSLSASGYEQLVQEVKNELDPDTIVAVSGRFPKGRSKAEIREFLSEIRQLGVKLILDSNSMTLDDLTEIRPWLIKPNEHELAMMLGEAVADRRDALKKAQMLQKKGISNVLVTLGAEGIAFAGEGGEAFLVSAPEITARSAVGAGDSTIAGFLCGVQRQLPTKDKVRLACAFGAAACMTEGTDAPVPQEVAVLFEKVKLC